MLTRRVSDPRTYGTRELAAIITQEWRVAIARSRPIARTFRIILKLSWTKCSSRIPACCIMHTRTSLVDLQLSFIPITGGNVDPEFSLSSIDCTRAANRQWRGTTLFVFGKIIFIFKLWSVFAYDINGKFWKYRKNERKILGAINSSKSGFKPEKWVAVHSSGGRTGFPSKSTNRSLHVSEEKETL